MNNNQMFYSTDNIKYRYKIRKSRTGTNAIQLNRLVKIVKLRIVPGLSSLPKNMQ